MKTKKQFYVVIHGRQPGIYTEWFGVGGAAEQVVNFPEAIYKGFFTREEAINWLRSFPRETLLQLAPNLLEALEEDSNPDQSPTLAETITGLLQEGKVVIFTDGSADPASEVGGYAAILRYKDHVRELSGGYRNTTSNRMELRACLEALRALKRPSEVVIFSDSQYLVNAMQKGWARNWQAQGWSRKDGGRTENADLWEQLLALCEEHRVEFRWIKGHNSTRENERCDQLAMKARQGCNLPEDRRGI